jgi:transposase-like protein
MKRTHVQSPPLPDHDHSVVRPLVHCKIRHQVSRSVGVMQEREVDVDGSTIFRRVQRYARELDKVVRWYQGYRSGS